MSFRRVPPLALAFWLAAAAGAPAFAPQAGNSDIQTADNNSTIRNMLVTGQGLPAGVQIGDAPAADTKARPGQPGSAPGQNDASTPPKAKYGDIIIHQKP
ncbi:MAG: hypothetical protein AB7D57_05525 [Desulfovibrionaceae bacterium]